MGKSISAPGTAILLKELIMHPDHEISKTAALQKHWAHFDTFELDRIAESLVAQHAINITLRRNGDGKHEQWFILNKKVLERYMEREKKEKG